MLALKLCLVPSFLLLITLAGWRWGPVVAGRLAGLPVSAGPIVFVVAIEQGTAFAAASAEAALAAVASTVTFCAVYAHASKRHGWFGALLAAASSWSVAAFLLTRLPASPGWSLLLATGALLAAPWVFPRAAPVPPARGMSATELVLRALAGAMLTLAVSWGAERIGSAWSGTFATYPILGTVLAVFSHMRHGPAHAVALLRSMATGMMAFSAFFLTLTVLLEKHGIGPAFAAAIAAALIAQIAATRLRG